MNKIKFTPGLHFSARIQGLDVKGKIQVEDGRVFLCQNSKKGCECENKLGYKYSWTIGGGTPELYEVTNLKLFKTKITEAFGYKITKRGETFVFGCGEVKVTKNDIKSYLKLEQIIKDRRLSATKAKFIMAQLLHQ